MSNWLVTILPPLPQKTGSSFNIMALAVASLGFALATSSPSRADRVDCLGYPESRQFVDSQSWWRRTPNASGTDFGHVHLGGCIPEREVHTTDITLDVRVVMHANPGKIAEVVLVTKTPSTETTRIKDKSLAGMTCPTGTCEAWLRWKVPLSWFDSSGLQEIRYRVYVDEPDGNRMIASLNYQTYIKNGRPLRPVTRYPYLRGKGWYTGAGYCEASFRQPLPDVGVGTAFSPALAMVDHGKSTDRPVTHAEVLRDADFHAGKPGKVLAENSDSLGPTPVPVGGDAAQGVHRLTIKADCKDPRGSTNSGILVVPFKIN